MKGAANEIWSQQNNFAVDDENKVTHVDDSYTNSSNQAPINTILHTYFDKTDYPEDTLAFLNNLYAQVKPSLHVVKLNS